MLTQKVWPKIAAHSRIYSKTQDDPFNNPWILQYWRVTVARTSLTLELISFKTISPSNKGSNSLKVNKLFWAGSMRRNHTFAWQCLKQSCKDIFLLLYCKWFAEISLSVHGNAFRGSRGSDTSDTFQV